MSLLEEDSFFLQAGRYWESLPEDVRQDSQPSRSDHPLR